jgi:hypothetical protein
MGGRTPNIPIFRLENVLTPLESALPKNAPVTPLQSADPKTKDLKSFRIRRSEKGWGEGGKLLTRIEGLSFAFVTSLRHYIFTSLSRSAPLPLWLPDVRRARIGASYKDSLWD